MLTRLSLNSKRSDNIHLHPSAQFNEKQNNQKNLNRTKRSNKPNRLEQCLFIKPVESKNYLTNADTKVNIQSSYNSIQPTIDTRSKHSSRPSHNPILSSPPHIQKRLSDTQQYCQLYGRNILIQHELKRQCKTKFLQLHEINATLRARMLDWMVEVMESYKFTLKTYFASVDLMDRYLAEVGQNVPLSQLHILGVTSMHVATKMEEVYPLKLKTVYEKIVHKKISKDCLTEMEMKLFAVLGHKTNSWTFFDLAALKVYNQVNIEDPSAKEKLQNVLSFISKFIIYDYQLYTKFDMETLAEVVANIGAKICGLKYESEISLECDDEVSRTYKSFKTTFKGLNNIFKFTDESTVSLVDSYFFDTKMY